MFDFNFILTKSTTPIIGPISNLFGLILDAIYNGLFTLFRIENLGLTIIVFTIITRLLLLPLAIKQQKTMMVTQKMQPELKKIQDKYRNKKDAESQKKMQQELTEVYQKYNASPLAGCLTTLLQIPIIFALFDVMRNIPAHINSIKVIYTNVVSQITNVEGYQTILESLSIERNINIRGFDIDSIITFLSNLNDWELITSTFAGINMQIQGFVDQISQINQFLGVNLADAPGLAFPGILIPILAVASQFFASRTMQMTSNNKDNPAAQSQKTMMYILPFISGFFVIAMPAGLGLYWITSSVVQGIQQVFINKVIIKEKEVG
ncbi:YidC/Oxa1 family membrane protein insertase [Natranaerovirga pectinivora]|uniref:YidC/Oxa1 family membrane protein insertase n=1 Tax=Natranaerovirga pectinivora TaxID=682400 RepID=A0A4R3MIE9_9FIRM|nr:YidC/Oxa1 family membrane protein insertase [Natranaerovirga pectinivora]TCT12244.1 YidC/Oxa1 family membrane protein insertase [Natranaerovirga pectinivora]